MVNTIQAKVIKYSTLLHMERRLGVSGNMGDDALEYLWFVSRRSAQFGIKILELDLLPPKVVAKPPECTPLIFFSGLVREGVVLDALAHRA